MTYASLTFLFALLQQQPTTNAHHAKFSLAAPTGRAGWTRMILPKPKDSVAPVRGLMLQRPAHDTLIKASAYDRSNRTMLERAGDVAAAIIMSGARQHKVKFADDNTSVTVLFRMKARGKDPAYEVKVCARRTAEFSDHGYVVLIGAWPKRHAKTSEPAFDLAASNVTVLANPFR